MIPALLGLVLTAAGAQVQPRVGDSETNAPLIAEGTLRPGEIIGNEQIMREYIKFGTNEFQFEIPNALRFRAPDIYALVLSSRDDSYFVTLRILPGRPADADLRAEQRRWVETRYPDALAIKELTTPVDEHQGLGLQLHLKPEGVPDRQVQLVWVPCTAGILEFVLDADVGAIRAAQQSFNVILLSFRSNERGRITIQQHLDKS